MPSWQFFLYDQNRVVTRLTKPLDVYGGKKALPDCANRLVWLVEVLIADSGQWQVRCTTPLLVDEAGVARTGFNMAIVAAMLDEEKLCAHLKPEHFGGDIGVRRLSAALDDPPHTGVLQALIATKYPDLGKSKVAARQPRRRAGGLRLVRNRRAPPNTQPAQSGDLT